MRDKPNSSAVCAACLAAVPGGTSGVSLLHDGKIGIDERSLSVRENVFSPLCDEKTKSWWSQTGSNRRPQACKASALPTELWPRTAAPAKREWWAWEDLNFRPHAYQARALTN